MSPYKMSKIERGVRAVLAFKDMFNQHDVDGLMALIAENCTFENPEPAPDGSVYAGKQAIWGYFADLFQADAEAQFKGEEVFGMGNRCVLRWRYSWKDAAGQEKYVRGVDVFKIEQGLIVEKFSYMKG